MWVYKGNELGVEGIIGVPNRDMTDEEFAEASAKINGQFPDQLGSLERSGLWERVTDRIYGTQQKAEAEAEETDTQEKTQIDSSGRRHVNAQPNDEEKKEVDNG